MYALHDHLFGERVKYNGVVLIIVDAFTHMGRDQERALPSHEAHGLEQLTHSREDTDSVLICT